MATVNGSSGEFLEVEVSIDHLDLEGNGVGVFGGRPVAIPFVLPGERIRGKIYRRERDLDRGEPVEILEPSRERIVPPCPYFGRCGGCQYQHMAYGRQLELKRDHIAGLFSALPRGLPPVAIPIPSPKIYHYRTKLTPHHGRIRGGGDEPIGFLEATRHRICDIDRCPIAVESIGDALAECRRKIRATPTKRGGTALLRRTETGVTGDHRALVAETVSGKKFHFLAGDFFQNNGSILPDFVRHVVESAAGSPAEYLVDAYCGVGLFSLSAAHLFRAVAGIEISGESVRLAGLNASLQGVANAEFFTGSAENIFAAIAFPPEKTTVLLDPPRVGCGGNFLDQLLRFGPSRIVYVSCGPRAQVRELEKLLAHYAAVTIQPIDLFPQTRHIENVVVLERRNLSGVPGAP